MQRVHPFTGPVSAAHAPCVVASGVGTAWQPARTGAPLQSQVHVWLHPSVAREKLLGCHRGPDAAGAPASASGGGGDMGPDGGQPAMLRAIAVSAMMGVRSMCRC
jgi:hypothetical protein